MRLDQRSNGGRTLSKTNVERLVEAGLVEQKDIAQDDAQVINELSQGEIGLLIAAGKKILSNAKPGAPVMKVVF